MNNPSSTPSESHIYRQVAACLPRQQSQKQYQKPLTRKQLSDDIDAFIDAGGSVDVLPSMEIASSKLPAFATDGMGW